MCIVDDKIQCKTLCAVKCCNYNTWKLFAWWLHIQFGLSYSCNPYVGVSCMWVYLNPHVGVSHMWVPESLCWCFLYVHTRNGNIGFTPIGQSKLLMQPPSNFHLL